jgi:hypothetical protein
MKVEVGQFFFFVAAICMYILHTGGNLNMPDSLLTLEERRRELLQQIASLGDFRSGSISAVTTRCGKSTCHCARPKDPGHGPTLRLTYKVKGQSRIETLSAPGALRKAQQEIATFRQFHLQVQSLIEVNAAICRLRPLEVAEKEESLEKKRRKRSNKKWPGK